MVIISGKTSEMQKDLVKYCMGLDKGERNTTEFRIILKGFSIVGVGLVEVV